MPRSTSLRDAIADRLAAQWVALGCQLAGPAETGMVDLEAAIAATATLHRAEDARIREAGIAWSVAFGQAVNTSRLKRVAAEMQVDDDLSRFAADIAVSGGPRWPMATGMMGERAARGKVQVRDLAATPRLVWRLRSAFGVNARADILAALITDPTRGLTIADLTRATRFTKRNVAVAVAAMDLAGVVEVGRTENRDRVTLPAGSPFRTWLRQPRAGGAVDWVARLSVALRTASVLDATEDATEPVQLVEARVSVESLLDEIAWAGLPRPDLARTGMDFTAEYAWWADEVARLLREV